MLVYKFGGGVLSGPDGIKRMTDILSESLSQADAQDILLVVSALGKTTNAFESLHMDWMSSNDHSESFNNIITYHAGLIEELLPDSEDNELIVEPIFIEIRKLLSDEFPKEEGNAYDQLVSLGEILSSRIISAYLNHSDIKHVLVDASDMILTDSNFQCANVNWEITEDRISGFFNNKRGDANLKLKAGKPKVFLTQGFISSDIHGNRTTLGREGSDFSAAIFASILNATELVLWKDVPGIMTGDPQRFSEVDKMDQVSYLEAIELSYFGAKVVHPNTIKPLQNRNIPLTIKSIAMPGDPGTVVLKDPLISKELPVIIIKANQVLLSLQPRDFSFIMESAVSDVFAILAKYGMRVNLLQHGAISLSFCIDYNETKLNKLVGDLIGNYKVLYNSGLDLLTIRHYNTEVVEKLTGNRKIFVQQQSRNTARFVLV